MLVFEYDIQRNGLRLACRVCILKRHVQLQVLLRNHPGFGFHLLAVEQHLSLLYPLLEPAAGKVRIQLGQGDIEPLAGQVIGNLNAFVYV